MVPKWTAALLKGDTVYINGDGETSRDFCYIANAVQANLLAATSESAEARNQVYNVAVGDRTTLNALFGLLRDNLAAHGVKPAVQPVHRDFRAGDVRHSQADLGKAAAPAGLRAHAPAGRRDGGGDAVVCGAGEMNQIWPDDLSEDPQGRYRPRRNVGVPRCLCIGCRIHPFLAH